MEQRWIERFWEITESGGADTWDSFDTLEPRSVAGVKAVPGVTALAQKTSACHGFVHLDFETRNTGGCDLNISGARLYAAHPLTEIIALTYHFKGGSRRWNPKNGLLAPLAWCAADPAIRFVTFGEFELAIWESIMAGRFDFPPIPLERWDDARATSSYLALPRSLEKVLPVIGSTVVKDTAGRRLVLSLSRPNKTTGAYPEVTAEILQKVFAYNQSDVDGLAQIHSAVGSLEGRERAIWELNHRINARGVLVDLPFVRAAKRLAEASKDALVAEFEKLTGGLAPGQVAKTRDWLKGQGLGLENLQDETIQEALEEQILPADVRRVVTLRGRPPGAGLAATV